ncbi:MAG: divergent polysaccharide deacetylase family protein [Spirochaetales bacterium]|nr:divergent polysaccharide deacetylase family protein [Spirochaetales bacterium]
MSAKKQNRKRTEKKRTPRKKKPKIILDNKSVMLLSASIIFLCAVFLSMAFVFSSPKKEKQPKVANVEQPVLRQEQKIKSAEKNKISENINQPKKVQPEKKEAVKKPVEIQPEVKKIPFEKKTQPISKPEVKKEEPRIASVNPPAKKNEEIKIEKYSIPPAKNGATLVFIIDDGGYDTYNLKLYTSLPFPIAIAVLPKLAHSKDCATIVRNSGQELMLHQPMQAQNLKLNPGEGAILPDMSLSEVYKQVSENIAEIGPIKGLNNHEGSLITCDVMKIGAVLDAVLDNGIFFVDSRTSAQTKAPQAALERDMKILERDVFIDDIISKDEMLAQIYRGLGIANKNGKVIMIGHVDKSAKILPQLLNDMYPYLKQKGYKFAFPSQIQK